MVVADTRTALIVEDEPSTRELLASLLSAEGYAIQEAKDGAEAILALDQPPQSSSSFSIVVLDMMLPEIDGVAVLSHLAALGADVPVIAISASSQQLVAAAAAGAQEVVAKPFDVATLLAMVAQVRGPRPSTVGDLLVELAEVERGLREALSAMREMPDGGWLDETVPEPLAHLKRAIPHLHAARLLLRELD
jgi:two-component system OmpR family response regulator